MLIISITKWFQNFRISNLLVLILQIHSYLLFTILLGFCMSGIILAAIPKNKYLACVESYQITRWTHGTPNCRFNEWVLGNVGLMNGYFSMSNMFSGMTMSWLRKHENKVTEYVFKDDWLQFRVPRSRHVASVGIELIETKRWWYKEHVFDYKFDHISIRCFVLLSCGHPRWRRECFRHSRYMHNPHFDVSGKRFMLWFETG